VPVVRGLPAALSSINNGGSSGTLPLASRSGASVLSHHPPRLYPQRDNPAATMVTAPLPPQSPIFSIRETMGGIKADTSIRTPYKKARIVSDIAVTSHKVFPRG
jgi:hypothetical protein